MKNFYGPKGTRGEKAHMAFQFDLFVKDIQHVCAAASRFSSYLNVGRPGLRSDSHVIMFCHWVVLFKLLHFLSHNVMNNKICQTK